MWKETYYFYLLPYPPSFLSFKWNIKLYRSEWLTFFTTSKLLFTNYIFFCRREGACKSVASSTFPDVVKTSLNQPINQLASQPIIQPTNLPNSPSINQRVSQSTKQSIRESSSQSSSPQNVHKVQDNQLEDIFSNESLWKGNKLQKLFKYGKWDIFVTNICKPFGHKQFDNHTRKYFKKYNCRKSLHFGNNILSFVVLPKLLHYCPHSTLHPLHWGENLGGIHIFFCLFKYRFYFG